jgi:putative flippase GtrA
MTVPDVMEKLRGPMGRKLFRYSMASVVAVTVSQVCIIVFVGILNMEAVLANTLATLIAAVPSYEMNRKWAWGKTGRGHFWKEVVPFWGLALLGWAFSTVCVYFMQRYANHHHFSHVSKTFWVDVVNLSAFGVLWIAKFIIFNQVLFKHQHHEHAPAAVTEP